MEMASKQSVLEAQLIVTLQSTKSHSIFLMRYTEKLKILLFLKEKASITVFFYHKVLSHIIYSL